MVGDVTNMFTTIQHHRNNNDNNINKVVMLVDQVVVAVLLPIAHVNMFVVLMLLTYHLVGHHRSMVLHVLKPLLQHQAMKTLMSQEKVVME
jgi:hypothetical protein